MSEYESDHIAKQVASTYMSALSQRGEKYAVKSSIKGSIKGSFNTSTIRKVALRGFRSHYVDIYGRQSMVTLTLEPKLPRGGGTIESYIHVMDSAKKQFGSALQKLKRRVEAEARTYGITDISISMSYADASRSGLVMSRSLSVRHDLLTDEDALRSFLSEAARKVWA